ncbi:GDSL-type esterase/lipase family protein [Curtobacterium sp. ISL-83]|uniref:GDSL-type esterase/lipase family protein n=1 Tax=Curtobacterium sp. ISL-83 TaxID=2819145 RepID=UPI001BECC237|nr:GDSL-type esterase/lipase family protein [Curtobacterium sp. ISL-83]MBT2502336.1 hypothetical protein [Curtobacterium sp. ISL-83]
MLTGSSFFERWLTSEKDLAPFTAVNIGIGGTKVGDHLFYFHRMVPPLAPTALVAYIGSNDLNGIPFMSKKPLHVTALVLEYVELARRELPMVPIFIVAITVTPSRKRVRADIVETNRRLRDASQSGAFTFIDAAPALLTPTGDIDLSLFGRDRLHLNRLGYERFAQAIRSELVRTLTGTG